MPLTITHQFVSAIADRAADIVAGKVVPTKWNDVHSVSGALQANEITNIPAGTVTAIEVQAAINQLASLIPAVGPGTDPLALVNGLSVSTHNPTVSTNPNDQWAVSFSLNTDCSTVTPDFANTEVLNISLNATNGQATYGPVTQVKETIIGLSAFANYNASGQKFLYNNRIASYGMSDTGVYGGQNIVFGGGPIQGDEGQCWGSVANLRQQNFLARDTVGSVPAPSTVNTTTTQAITRSKNAQTVTVVGTAGAVNGDWVVVDQEVPTNSPNEEAVQIISFTPTSITGIFRCNHLNGATITPALRLTVGNPSVCGQDRVIVNFTQPSYSTGTVSTIAGGGFTGLGTNWTNNMVGGNALNIGAISLLADDYTGSPFSGVSGPLRSWYQINVITNPTALGIFTTSVAGDGSYHGKGPGAGTYVIRPCAKILRIITDSNGNYTGELICENSTSTWTAGDSIECVICPYADVTGWQYAMEAYTNGGAYRDFMSIRNGGGRTFDSVFRVWDAGPIGGPGGADTICWRNVFDIQTTCNTGIYIGSGCVSCAIRLSPNDAAGAVLWGTGEISTNAHFRINTTNQALTLATINGYTAPAGLLVFANANTGENFETNQIMMKWNGYLQIVPTGSGNQMIQLDNVTGAVDFEHGFFRWKSDTLEIGTEKGGAGTLRDFVLKTGTVEQLRLIAGDTIKFANPSSFSANGIVATSLTGIGPVGASTTVQTWLTIKDSGGITRYIPCF